MIQKYSFGKPLETGAVVGSVPESTQEMQLMQLTESEKVSAYRIRWMQGTLFMGLANRYAESTSVDFPISAMRQATRFIRKTNILCMVRTIF